MPRIFYAGATEYDLYMTSAAWKVKRAQRIVDDGGQCTRCGSSDDLQVHHLNYNRLGDEPMDDLRTLCKVCHQKEHGRDPVVSLATAFDRRQVSETHDWARDVRVRAARAQRELDGLFTALVCEDVRDPRMEQVGDLLTEIMEAFEQEYAEDATRLAPLA